MKEIRPLTLPHQQLRTVIAEARIVAEFSGRRRCPPISGGSGRPHRKRHGDGDVQPVGAA